MQSISKIHLEWTARLEDDYAFDEHIHRIMGHNIVPFELERSSYVNCYSVRFANEEQEKTFCPLIQSDPRVKSFGPVRGFAIDDEIHDVCRFLKVWLSTNKTRNYKKERGHEQGDQKSMSGKG